MGRKKMYIISLIMLIICVTITRINELERDFIISQTDKNNKIGIKECEKIDSFIMKNEKEFIWYFSIPCEILNEMQEIEDYERMYESFILFKINCGCRDIINIKIGDENISTNISFSIYPFSNCNGKYYEVIYTRMPAEELDRRFEMYGIGNKENIEISIYIVLYKYYENCPAYDLIRNCGIGMDLENIWNFTIRVKKIKIIRGIECK